MIAYWWCLCVCINGVCVPICVRTLMCQHKMSISTFTACLFVCVLHSRVCVGAIICMCIDMCIHAPALVWECVFAFAAIISGVGDLWSVLWLPQGTYKTTEWPFIAFLLCLVLRFIHHSVFLFFPCLSLSLPIGLSPIFTSISLSPSPSLSAVSLSNSLWLFSLIKTDIDHLSAAHQWNHHYCVLLFVTIV